MFVAGGNSSWWLSGMSTYMTIFSASTFVVWGGVAYKSGLVAALIGNLVGVACFLAGKWFAGRWRRIRLNSPGEFVKIRFGNTSLNFYSIVGMLGKGVHASVALYAVSIVMSTLIYLPEGSAFADASGHLAVGWAVILLGAITLIYTAVGGFLAVLMLSEVTTVLVSLRLLTISIPLASYLGGDHKHCHQHAQQTAKHRAGNDHEKIIFQDGKYFPQIYCLVVLFQHSFLLGEFFSLSLNPIYSGTACF